MLWCRGLVQLLCDVGVVVCVVRVWFGLGWSWFVMLCCVVLIVCVLLWHVVLCYVRLWCVLCCFVFSLVWFDLI